MNETSSYLQTVGRALEILELIGRFPGLTLSELARRTGMNTTVIYRLLFTLSTVGFLQQEPGGKRYYLGDKTLLDTLIPASEAYAKALEAGKDFSAALDDFKAAAKAGWQSTENMVAKIGRASRLGERSRGVLDAGATSCYLMMNSLAESIQKLIG